MKRIVSFVFATLLLAACAAGSGTLRYTLTFDTDDAARQKQLTEAVTRVMERRAAALQAKAVRNSVAVEGGKTVLTVALDDAAAVAPFAEGLAVPFTFRIMRQAEAGEKAAITLEQFGAFAETGVTEDHVDWLTAGTGPQTLKGSVTIAFTPEGKDLLKKMFESTKGKKVALFVRGRLVSQLVSDGKSEENIQIAGIPSPDLAAVFADDVNVGAHVTFLPAT